MVSCIQIDSYKLPSFVRTVVNVHNTVAKDGPESGEVASCRSGPESGGANCWRGSESWGSMLSKLTQTKMYSAFSNFYPITEGPKTYLFSSRWPCNLENHYLRNKITFRWNMCTSFFSTSIFFFIDLHLRTSWTNDLFPTYLTLQSNQIKSKSFI